MFKLGLFTMIYLRKFYREFRKLLTQKLVTTTQTRTLPVIQADSNIVPSRTSLCACFIDTEYIWFGCRLFHCTKIKWKNLKILNFLLYGALVLLRLHTREFHQNISHISCSFFHDKMCTGGKMLNIYHTTQRVVLVSSGHFCNCSRNPSVFACAWGHNILLTIVAHIYCECGVF